MKQLFRRLRDARFGYTHLVEVRISRDALLHNLKAFRHIREDQQIAPVLKSNAYGHGLVQVARVFDREEDIPFFVIDSYYEALILRNEGIKTPLLVMGDTTLENIVRCDLKAVSFAITSLEQLATVAGALTKHQCVHIKVDTGMKRQGLLLSELDEAIGIIKGNSHLQVEGVCSHFSDADGEDAAFTATQIAHWSSIAKDWRKQFPDTKYYHLAATAGEYFADKIDANAARVGIGIYGVNEGHSKGLGLIPALSMHTRVSLVKDLKKGETTGYGNIFTASRDMRIATVPVGYYEGVDRRLSNKGAMQIQNVDCPIVGRVSMNITTIDVTDVEGVTRGDDVVVFSDDPDAPNSISALAKAAGMISWELLVHIPSALRRTVV